MPDLDPNAIMTQRPAPAEAAPPVGDPCPNGCASSERWEPFAAQPLRSNEDGEISCPVCWDCFGIADALDASDG